MGNNGKKLITVSEETQIDRPANREMFPVEKIDWERLKRLIRNINFSSNRWENAGWFMLATTVALFVTTFTLPTNNKTPYLVAAIASLIITFILFFVSWIFSKTSQNSKSEVLEEMEQMEKKIVKREEESSMASKQLKVLSAIYGTEKKNIDIASELNSLINEDELNVLASNDIAGDPHPGILKEVKIKYIYQGREGEKGFKEGETIKLP